MKFQMLEIGACFECEGKEYVRTGPLTANSEGRQRMIPCFAALKPVVAEVPQAAKAQSAQAIFDVTHVIRAFDAFHAECQRLLQ